MKIYKRKIEFDFFVSLNSMNMDFLKIYYILFSNLKSHPFKEQQLIQ